MMLNTDLHNSSVRADKKMKVEDFIRNLRGSSTVVVVVVVVSFFNHKTTLAVKHLKHKTQYRPKRYIYIVIIELIVMNKKNSEH